MLGDLLPAQDLSEVKLHSTYISLIFEHIANPHSTQIPSLNTTSHIALDPETLVRFRCMVQDTNLGPEIYLSINEVIDCSTGQKKLRSLKYRDAELADMVSWLRYGYGG